MNNKAQEKPDDGLAPCGCRVRFDNDGLIRLAQCNLHSAAPDLLQACKAALDLVKVARNHFPKSMHDSDKFKLENTCATIGKAIEKAGAQ